MNTELPRFFFRVTLPDGVTFITTRFAKSESQAQRDVWNTYPNATKVTRSAP